MSSRLAQIEALAPDRSALAAAAKLLEASDWPLLSRDATGTVIWGQVQGSGSAPYRLSFVPADGGHKCSCPSRKFPCKHVLALMLHHAHHPDRFVPGPTPPWVADWLVRRRPGIPMAGTETPPSDARPGPDKPPDPAGEAQTAARRAKAQDARLADATAALDALDVWIGDQLQEGLATFPQRATAACRSAAQRLVDGKVPGLALWLDELPPALFGLPEASRPGFLVRELGRVYLAAAALRRGDALPAPLQADARRAMGWGQKREELLADPAAARVEAQWTALGTRTVLQVDKLHRVETWLAAQDGQAAVLLDYAPAGMTLPPHCASGERFTAELAFFPSAAPLRAAIVRRGPTRSGRFGPECPRSAQQAWTAHLARLAALPWLGDDLLQMAETHLIRSGGALFLADADRSLLLPLPARQSDMARPLLGLPLTVAMLWDGRVATLLAADTPLGPWFDAT